MKVTFIEHSGFMVEMEQNVLLFDYYQGEIPSFDGSKTLTTVSTCELWLNWSTAQTFSTS